MGSDVVKAAVTPITYGVTKITGSANDKLYYDCPTCYKEVYVYRKHAAFKGKECHACRCKGDSKIYYNCPSCNKRVFVYKRDIKFKGIECFACQ